jgi:hypothetical protein
MVRGTRPVALLLLAVSLGVALSSPAEAPRRTDELMHKSGLWKQLAQIEPQLKAAMAEQRAQAKSKAGGDGPVLDELAWLRLSRAAERAYAPDGLRKAVADGVARRLAPEDEAAALRWLDSPVGREFTRLEEAVGEVEEYRRMGEGSADAMRSASPERIEAVGHLVDESGADLEATVTIQMIMGVAYGVAASTGRIDEAHLARFRAKLEADRPRMVAQSRQRAIPMMVYAYRSMSDADLASYLAFTRSPAGRRYMEASVKAMEATLSEAAAALGRYTGELASEGPGKRS